LRAKPVRATGWIAAESRYRLEVNGARIQWGPAPCDPRWAEADPLDLTSALAAGPNVIGATVLYYGHGDGTWPIGKPGFLFWLDVEYADGSREKIVSDPLWETLLCRAWKPGQYRRWFLRALQEEFDARLYPQDWSTNHFSPGAEWIRAMALEGSPNKPALSTKFVEYAMGIRNAPDSCELRARSVPMLREPMIPAKALAESLWIRWKRSPIEYFECRPPDAFEAERTPSATKGPDNTSWQINLGEGQAAALTFEFEEQIVGWPCFSIEAPAGTVVELMVQEGHLVGGPALLNTTMRDGWTRFICRDGVNDFECFDFESFRWLQVHVREARGTITIRNVGARRRIFPWAHEPEIRTSEPALQRLFDASINTLHNCAQDTLVDGMGRERQPYSGDCGHQQHAIRLAFGDNRSIERFLITYSQGMTTDGYFLDCWPAYDRLARIMERQLDVWHLGPILDHGVQLVFDCWHHYLYTGKLEAIREAYPRLLRFANYLNGIVGTDSLLAVENLGTPCVWMDYQAYQQQSGIAPPFSQRRKQCAFNLYTAAMFQHALAPLCRAFGDSRQADAAANFGRTLEQTAVKRFWSSEQRVFVNNLPWLAEEKNMSLCDRSLSNAILFNQCPNGDIAAAVQTLADAPKAMGLSYPANAGWRLWALAKAGRGDVVLKELRTRWATMDSVKLNNTLQEGWRSAPDSGSQWSHCALAPLYVAHQSIAGIRPLDPGAGRIEIRPQLADLEHLELVSHLAKGPVRFSARGKLGAREFSIELPPGCAGELVVRRAEKLSLPSISGEAPSDHVRYRLPAGQRSTFTLAYS
jgi:alpha-L-rhamnosidase